MLFSYEKNNFFLDFLRFCYIILVNKCTSMQVHLYVNYSIQSEKRVIKCSRKKKNLQVLN